MLLNCKRLFSNAAVWRSHIGSAPIFTPPEVAVSVSPLLPSKLIQKGRKRLRLSQVVTVKGPRGTVSIQAPDFARIDLDAAHQKVNVTVQEPGNKTQKAMWGTLRSLVNNNVIGVNEGHLAILKFVGTGYRAQVQEDGKFVSVKVGASIPQGLTVPEGIIAKTPVPTTLVLEGCDKQQLNLFAAKIRQFHPPEPYKGKGIFVNGETIKLKNKKIK